MLAAHAVVGVAPSQPRRVGRRAMAVLGALSLSTSVVALSATTPADATATVALYGWGNNSYGQFGNGLTGTVTTPTQLSLPDGSVPVAAATGAEHSLAVDANGTLYAAGLNNYGQLGTGNKVNSNVWLPALMPSGVGAVAAAAGEYHSLVIGTDGNVYGFGYNGYGQVGDNTKITRGNPKLVALPAGTTAVAVAAGGNHSMALSSTGTVYDWGDNSFGQLGNGTTGTSSTPVAVALPGGVTATAIASSQLSSYALGSDGQIYAWGYNGYGELGANLTLASSSTTPVQVALPAGVTATSLVAGDLDALAVGSDGQLYGWGLGTGIGTGATFAPVTVSLPAGVSVARMAAGAYHTMFVGSDGTLYAWGANAQGQLGDGTTVDASAPQPVDLPPGSAAPSLLVSGPDAQFSFVVVPAGPAATATSLSIAPTSSTYGQSVTLTATVTGSDGQGTVTFSDGVTALTGCSGLSLVTVGSAKQASCSTSALVAGTHTLTAAYSGDGLAAASSDIGSLTVNPAPLMVTASSASSTYGGALPAITASYSGFVNGEGAGSLTTQPACTTTATILSPVGTYPTSCAGASDPN
ncbi:MAG TPA: Ig-like domain repeat protein, partial [Mycobacterium sp.]|nr:Ig-like domain repeat protein [Mycobacterium sp.]